MKKHCILLVCVLVFSATVQGVENKEESRSFVYFDGILRSSVCFCEKKATELHEGLGFAFANLNGLEGATLKPGQSYSITLERFAKTNIPLHPHWLFATGAGLDFTRYHFAGDIGLNGKRADNVTQFEPAPSGLSYKSSKLLAYYITFPVLLEYQTKAFGSDTDFWINGGVEGLLKYYSKSQVDIRTDNGIKKTSLGRDLNMRPVNLRFVARVGFGRAGIFGYYQPFSMFENGKGPDVQPFGIGITIN